MKFREKKALCDSICEYNWHEGELMVFVNDYEFDDFMKFMKDRSSILDIDGIPATIKNGYIAVPNFNKYLEMMDLDEDEIQEMFE